MKKITKPILKQVKNNKSIVARLVAETGKSYPTVMRWIRLNSDALTNATPLKVICEELKLNPEEVLSK